MKWNDLVFNFIPWTFFCEYINWNGLGYRFFFIVLFSRLFLVFFLFLFFMVFFFFSLSVFFFFFSFHFFFVIFRSRPFFSVSCFLFFVFSHFFFFFFCRGLPQKQTFGYLLLRRFNNDFFCFFIAPKNKTQITTHTTQNPFLRGLLLFVYFVRKWVCVALRCVTSLFSC